MAAPVRVAWINRQEWDDVKNCVLSNDVIPWQQAIDRIQLWKHRVNYKLSDSIELTQMAMMNLLALNSEGLMHQEQEQLRLSLSMTVVRFVTFITDAKQARMERRPVHVLAQKAGIPVWIVDIRHEAAHSKLPSLPLLVKALRFAFDYLKGRYWNQETTSCDPCADIYDDTGNDDAQCETQPIPAVQQVTPSVSLCQNLQDVVVEYQRIQHGGHTGASDAASALLQQNADFILSNQNSFLDVLCEEGYLLLSAEQLQAMELRHAVSTNRDPKLPRRLFLFWKPLHSFVARIGMKAGLVFALARALTDAITVRNWQIVAWIQHLLQPKGGQPTERTYSELHWPGLVAYCMNSMSTLVVGLLQLVLDLMPDVHRLDKSKLIEVARTYLQTPAAAGFKSTVRCTEAITHTAADVHCNVQGQSVSDEGSGVHVSSESSWRPAPCDANWVAIPLGHVFPRKSIGDMGFADAAHRWLDLSTAGRLQQTADNIQQLHPCRPERNALRRSCLGMNPVLDGERFENQPTPAASGGNVFLHRATPVAADEDDTAFSDGDPRDYQQFQQCSSLNQFPALVASVDELGW